MAAFKRVIHGNARREALAIQFWPCAAVGRVHPNDPLHKTAHGNLIPCFERLA